MDNFFTDTMILLLKETLHEKNIQILDETPKPDYIQDALNLFNAHFDVFERIVVLPSKLPNGNLGMLVGGAMQFDIPIILLDYDNMNKASYIFSSMSDCTQTTILHELGHALQLLEYTYCDENNSILDIQNSDDWAEDFANNLFYLDNINEDVFKLIEFVKLKRLEINL